MNSDPNLYCTVNFKNSSCFYDYGSGLTYYVNNTWSIYGISVNNTDIQNCDNQVPIFHTMVPKYLDWIKSNMVKNTTQPDTFITKRPDYTCGKPFIKPTSRIINGKPSVANSWPWTVSFWLFGYGSLINECVGTIISNRFILTAAHCIRYPKFKTIFVSIGNVKLSYTSTFKNMIRAKRVIVHKLFAGPQDIKNDIALVELIKPIKFTSKVKKICLPLSSNVTVMYNKTVYVAGW